MKKLYLTYNNSQQMEINGDGFHWVDSGSLAHILTPYRKEGKTYRGLKGELLNRFPSEQVVLRASTDVETFKRLVEEFKGTSIRVVGKTDVTIRYFEDSTPHTHIEIRYPHETKMFLTTSEIVNINDWLNESEHWKGIYRELEEEIGSDKFTVYFEGDSKYMSTLLSPTCLDSMEVDVFYREPDLTDTVPCDTEDFGETLYDEFSDGEQYEEESCREEMNGKEIDEEDVLHEEPESGYRGKMSGFASRKENNILGWDAESEKKTYTDAYKSTKQALGNTTIPEGKWRRIEDGINNKDIPNDYTIVSTQLVLVENVNRLESVKNSWTSDNCRPKEPKYTDKHIKKEMKKRRGGFKLYLGRFEFLKEKKKQILKGLAIYVGIIALIYILSIVLAPVGKGSVSNVLLVVATVLETIGGYVVGFLGLFGFWYVVYSSFRHHYKPLEYDDGVKRREEVINDLEAEYRKEYPIYKKLVDEYEEKKAECLKKIEVKLVDNRTKLKQLEKKFPVVPKDYRDPQSLSYISNVLETNRVSISGAIHMYNEALARKAEEEAYDRMARAAEREARSRQVRETLKDGASIYSQVTVANSAKRLSKAAARKWR